jgi:hypothetical protein
VNTSQAKNTDEEEDFEGLTTYETLEAIIGAKLTRRLCNIYGGKVVYIPAYIAANHWLGEVVGYGPAQKLCKHYRLGESGYRLTLPKGDIHRAKENYLHIAELLNEGVSTPAVAIALNLHVRTVFRARNKFVEQRLRIHGQTIKQMLRDGKSHPDIAKQTNMPEAILESVIKRIDMSKERGRR